MTFIGHRKREGSNAYLFYGEWSNNELERPCQITEGTLAIKDNFQNSPNGKKQVVKITYPPFLFIECLYFSKIRCNLFNFEIQIILVKVGFYFLFSIVFGKMTFNGVFEFFQVNIGSWLWFKLFLYFSSLEQN